MNKLKKNAVAKTVAAILLSVSLFMAVVSGCVVAAAISYGDSRQMQAEAIYDGYMGNLVDNSSYQVDEYYKAYVESQDDTQENHTIRYYKDYFNEKNSNFYFEVVPDDAKKYPTLSNYKAEEYQYHDVRSRQTEVYAGQTTITCKLSLADIIDFWKNNYVPEEYDGEDYGIYEADEDAFTTSGEAPASIRDAYWDWSNISFADMTVVDSAIDDEGNADPYIQLDNTDFIYYLSNNADYRKAVARATKKVGDVQIYNESLTLEDDGSLTQSIDMYTPVSYTLYAYVKSDLTARDIYAESIVLRYCKPVVKAAPYTLAASIILILVMGGFLITASGHRKTQEQITCNAFDRIPYDLFLYVFFAVFATGVNVFDYYAYSVIDDLFLAAIYLAVVALLFPPLLMTTATRLKVSGWAMFGNTLIWRLIRLGVWIIKWVFRKLRDIFRFLGRHFNLYWKWVGGVLGIALFRFILVATSASPGLAVVLDWGCALLLVVVLIRVIVQLYRLKDGAKRIADGETDYKIDTSHMLPEFAEHGETLNCIQDSVRAAVEERMKSERMKTELITNVSHDIKTPLTSIINYVDILSKEGDLSDKEAEYLEVLQRQSARLKKLIEDLIEASKASTGNLEVHMEPTDVEMLLEQALGEFEERLADNHLQTVVTNHLTKKYGAQADAHVMADGRHLWRVFDNLIGNIVKYAQPDSRVYIDIDEAETPGELAVTFKNISKDPLNISGDELMERFVRGDRSRNTEGNGLGLSIAQSLMELQNGKVEIMIDGDLFKVVLLLKAGNCKN